MLTVAPPPAIVKAEGRGPVHTLRVARLDRPLYGVGAPSLLQIPFIALVGWHKPAFLVRPGVVRLARALARAGFVVAVPAYAASDHVVLRAAAAAGFVAGMLDTRLDADFTPPVPAAEDAALWLSLVRIAPASGRAPRLLAGACPPRAFGSNSVK